MDVEYTYRKNKQVMVKEMLQLACAEMVVSIQDVP